MSLSDLASLGSFVSGVAVLASLVFLYFQMRQLNQQIQQTEKNQRGIMQVEKASRSTAQLRFMADPGIIESYTKGSAGLSDITLNQFYQFRTTARAAFVSMEDSFLQHQQKLLDDTSFESSLASLKMLLSTPGHRAMWKRWRMGHEETFRTFMDQLLDKVGVVTPPSGDEELAAWHSDVAAELANLRD